MYFERNTFNLDEMILQWVGVNIGNNRNNQMERTIIRSSEISNIKRTEDELFDFIFIFIII